MVRAVPLVTALVTLLFLAGCLGTTDDLGQTSDEPTAPAILPAQDVQPIQGDPLPADGPTHDHADPSQHDIAVNMELLARPELDPSDDVHYWNSNIPLGLNIRFGELDVKGDWLAQCSRDTDGAYLWDISNRSDPQVAARLYDAGNCPDIKLTDDAAFAVIGGNKIYDLRDKDDVVLHEFETPGCHMCSVTNINGQEYIVLSAQGASTEVAGRKVTTGAGFTVVKFDRDPIGLEVVGRWQKDLVRDSVPTLAEQDIANTVHDQYVYHDKLLNKTLVVPAMWDYGIYVVDISDPANPTDLGH